MLYKTAMIGTSAATREKIAASKRSAALGLGSRIKAIEKGEGMIMAEWGSVVERYGEGEAVVLLFYLESTPESVFLRERGRGGTRD